MLLDAPCSSRARFGYHGNTVTPRGLLHLCGKDRVTYTHTVSACRVLRGMPFGGSARQPSVAPQGRPLRRLPLPGICFCSRARSRRKTNARPVIQMIRCSHPIVKLPIRMAGHESGQRIPASTPAYPQLRFFFGLPLGSGERDGRSGQAEAVCPLFPVLPAAGGGEDAQKGGGGRAMGEVVTPCSNRGPGLRPIGAARDDVPGSGERGHILWLQCSAQLAVGYPLDSPVGGRYNISRNR